MSSNMMKMLAGSSVLVVALVVGILYNKGFWDKWADKEGQVASELLAAFQQRGIPPEVGGPMSSCMASLVVVAADVQKCPLASQDPLLGQLGLCASQNAALAVAFMDSAAVCLQRLNLQN